MEDEYKKTVEDTVQVYINLYPSEYNSVVANVAVRRKELSELTTEEKKIGDMVEREINSYPEVLYNMIYINLTPEGAVWFSKKEAARWFTKRYPEFALAKI